MLATLLQDVRYALHGFASRPMFAVVGLGAALLLGRLASALLFGLAPTDPLAVTGAAGVLAGALLGASYWPARRASRLDPVVALRAE